MPSYKIIVGRLTKDAEFKETEKVDVIQVSVASNTYSSGKNVTEYNECYCFVNKDDKSKQVEAISKLYKGRFVVVLNGDVKISEYEKEGVKQQRSKVQLKTIYDILIDPDIDKLKAKIAELESQSGISNNNSGSISSSPIVDEDEIPF